MWIEKEVTLDKKKVDAKVNLGSDQSEVELPFFENWDDLGVIKGICECYGMTYPIKKDKAIQMSKKWSPYRSVATWYFWRSLDPIPVEY